MCYSAGPWWACARTKGTPRHGVRLSVITSSHTCYSDPALNSHWPKCRLPASWTDPSFQRLTICLMAFLLQSSGTPNLSSCPIAELLWGRTSKLKQQSGADRLKFTQERLGHSRLLFTLLFCIVSKQKWRNIRVNVCFYEFLVYFFVFIWWETSC